MPRPQTPLSPGYQSLPHLPPRHTHLSDHLSCPRPSRHAGLPHSGTFQDRPSLGALTLPCPSLRACSSRADPGGPPRRALHLQGPMLCSTVFKFSIGFEGGPTLSSRRDPVSQVACPASKQNTSPVVWLVWLFQSSGSPHLKHHLLRGAVPGHLSKGPHLASLGHGAHNQSCLGGPYCLVLSMFAVCLLLLLLPAPGRVPAVSEHRAGPVGARAGVGGRVDGREPKGAGQEAMQRGGLFSLCLNLC